MRLLRQRRVAALVELDVDAPAARDDVRLADRLQRVGDRLRVRRVGGRVARLRRLHRGHVLDGLELDLDGHRDRGPWGSTWAPGRGGIAYVRRRAASASGTADGPRLLARWARTADASRWRGGRSCRDAGRSGRRTRAARSARARGVRGIMGILIRQEAVRKFGVVLRGPRGAPGPGGLGAHGDQDDAGAVRGGDDVRARRGARARALRRRGAGRRRASRSPGATSSSSKTPAFAGALRGRIGPHDATAHDADVWRWALALVARDKGRRRRRGPRAPRRLQGRRCAPAMLE